MKNLTNNEVAKLLFWAETTGKSNIVIYKY